MEEKRQSMLIYCVEDNEDIRKTILYALKMADYECEGVADGESFFAGLINRKPDLILLDLDVYKRQGLMNGIQEEKWLLGI